MSTGNDHEASKSQSDLISVRATEMLLDYGKAMLHDELIDSAEVKAKKGIHGYYGFSAKRPVFELIADRHIDSLSLHIQAYPDFSSPESAAVIARLLDNSALLTVRALGSYAVGDEDRAVFSNLFAGEMLAVAEYSPAILREIVDEGLSELAT